jgi:hypothetical protein
MEGNGKSSGSRRPHRTLCKRRFIEIKKGFSFFLFPLPPLFLYFVLTVRLLDKSSESVLPPAVRPSSPRVRQGAQAAEVHLAGLAAIQYSVDQVIVAASLTRLHQTYI